jgi:hypothetical protein
VVLEFAEFLSHHGYAALWFHPNNQLVLVVYPPASETWSFLDHGGQPFHPEARLRIVARSMIPRPRPVALPSSPTDLQAASGIDPYFSSPTGANQAQQLLGRPRSPSSSRGSAASPTDWSSTDASVPKTTTPSFSTATTDTIIQTPSHDRADQKFVIRPEPSAEGNGGEYLTLLESINSTDNNADKVLGKHFGISYERLTQLYLDRPMSTSPRLDPSKARFFLAFPSADDPELRAVQSMLSCHTLPRFICTNHDIQGWEAFRTMLGQTNEFIGVVLLHFRCTDYARLPGFAKFAKTDIFNVFHISLSSSLLSFSTDIHLQRVFSSGVGILITEAAVVKYAHEVVSIIYWFASRAMKANSRYRLVLPPNFRPWLRKLMGSSERHARHNLAEIMAAISNMAEKNPYAIRNVSGHDPETESLDQWDDEGRPSLLVSHNLLSYESQSTNLGKENVLIEYFAEWALQNSIEHRRFSAITPNSAPEWEKWGHVRLTGIII